MKTMAIIQARMKSTRLPGKVLKKLSEKTVLHYVIKRCQAIEKIDAVWCAIPETSENDPVAHEAECSGATIYRGSETDVLDRFYQAAKKLRADVILRVCGDSPLIDPNICAKVLKLREKNNADFACNNMPPTWAHGLDCEVFTFEWLQRAAMQARDPYEREHVGPYVRTHADALKVNLKSPDLTMTPHRWTLDTPKDLAFFEALWPHLPEGPRGWGYEVPLDIVRRYPDLATINAGSEHSAKRGVETPH
jgi:spore coat polysaccharide biosynthesis protein SpsF (cytidylyltransferase family)